MELTKEVLLADQQAFKVQIEKFQHIIGYIDGLLAYLDRPEQVIEAEVVEPVAEQQEILDVPAEVNATEEVKEDGCTS